MEDFAALKTTGENTSTAGIWAGIAGTFSEIGAGYLANQFNKRRDEFNRYVIDKQADIARARSRDIINQLKRDGHQLVSAQRAGYAGQGVDVTSGSAAFTQAEAERDLALDVMRAELNGANEQWAYQVQKLDSQMGTDLADQRFENDALATIATGGVRAYQQYRRTQQAGLEN